jgi:hypothetical protein
MRRRREGEVGRRGGKEREKREGEVGWRNREGEKGGETN